MKPKQSMLLEQMMITLRKARVMDVEAQTLEVWMQAYSDHKSATKSLRSTQDPEYSILMSQRITYCEQKCKQYMESQL